MLLLPGLLQAQTEGDAIMMNKNQLCNGFLYNYSSWDHYWEGTLKRNNLNLGTVSTQSAMYMANYGITDNLNIIAGCTLCMDQSQRRYLAWNERSSGPVIKS